MREKESYTEQMNRKGRRRKKYKDYMHPLEQKKERKKLLICPIGCMRFYMHVYVYVIVCRKATIDIKHIYVSECATIKENQSQFKSSVLLFSHVHFMYRPL